MSTDCIFKSSDLCFNDKRHSSCASAEVKLLCFRGALRTDFFFEARQRLLDQRVHFPECLYSRLHPLLVTVVERI